LGADAVPGSPPISPKPYPERIFADHHHSVTAVLAQISSLQTLWISIIMADPEDRKKVDDSATEQTPLLAEREPQPESERDRDRDVEAGVGACEHDALVGRQSADDVGDGETEALPEPEKRALTAWDWAWRGLWTVVAAVVLGIFIKGWVDAGDTHVRMPKKAAMKRTLTMSL
jgi:hypothetical protein